MRETWPSNFSTVNNWTGKKSGLAGLQVNAMTINDEGRVTENWHLCLYVAGQTPHSLRAISNLKRLKDTWLENIHRIDIIDLIENPERARQDDILAIPTLMRRSPEPRVKIVGDLSNESLLLNRLGLEATGP